MTRSHHLGELQLATMRVLWQQGEATVAQVHEALHGERSRALTTIATMLTKMEKKGVVAHRLEGRQFVYRPTVSEVAVQRSMVSELTAQLFEGDATALVNHLLSEREVDAAELGALLEKIERREAREEG